MYSTPRAASIKAESNGQLWALHRNVFRKILMKRSGRKELMHCLRKIPLFKALTAPMIQLMADKMSEVTFSAGESIIKQGELGDSFYVVRSGVATVAEKKTLSKKSHPDFGENAFFGENALLKSGKREFTVTAKSDVRVSCISRSVFDESLGVSLQKIIETDKKMKDERSFALSGAGPPLAKIDTFGSVYSEETFGILVSRIGNNEPMAMKVIYKKAVEEQKQEESIVRELDLLKVLSKSTQFANCPCLPSLKSTYTDQSRLYVLFENSFASSVGEIVDSLGEGKGLDDAAVK